MRVNRGLLFWGLALITAGAVALAVQAGAVDRDIASDAWRLWPLILIAIGLSILFARGPLGPLGAALGGVILGLFGGALIAGAPFSFTSCGGDEMAETTRREGTFGASAAVSLEFNCGELEVDLESGDAWQLELNRAADGDEPRIDDEGGQLSVNSPDDGPFGLNDRRQEWQVVLPTETDLELEVDANAADSRLDLTDGSLTRLKVGANAGSVWIGAGGATINQVDIDANAGSVSIVLDEASELVGQIEFNAGSVEVCAADDTTLAFTLEDPNVTFSHNLDDEGLDRSGDVWTTPGTSPGSAAVRLRIDGNAASLALNPEDGCG